ncbi:SusC/RagA family TonB-linked outer membrane protein [Mucilaginibacter ginsenosidivorans]|uniref:TonB-dependent receptor n=1 Tax=Mucilaginibacter ginsenosidivorans TaxID=398053 RepID=A0A5B8V0E5_9SPHI|nr:TonB-dependent receptor [Mucilaginibacter ginsenosidivorans]QEC64722.1 TonB-dependent receptor [Mucilaginibacter ginsenosidivorans]
MIKKLRIIHVVTLVGLCLSLLLVSSTGFAQSNTVTGTVTDGDNGSPLPGVTITVKGARTTTVSDVNGHYSITASANGTLVFVYIGYATQEVPIGGQSAVNVKMATDNKALSEVVVVGYGTAKRKDLTGSVSSVTSAQIAAVPVTTLDQALQGRAAGVQVVSNDASPGGNISVLIRGIGSLASGGNGPLYVVDGYPLDGSINNINPSDIASIDVLKDASATAIYGIRAANGVVIVTTKKGRKDGVQVSFDAYNAFQSKPKEYHILNAQQWATLANEVADADPQHNFAELQQWRTPGSLTNADWQNAMYRTALTQSYSLAVRGGSEKVQSATSLGYYDQKGIVLGSYFKRVTLGSNVDYNPMKWFKSSTSVKYTYQDSNNPFGTGSLVQLTQLPPTLDGGNKQTSLIKDNNNNYGFYNPQNTYVAKYGNPVFTVENDRYQNLTNFLLANTSLEATIIDGLKIKTNAGVNVNEYNGYFFQPEDDRLDQQYNLGGATQNAFYSQHLNQTFNWLWENTISYDKTFGKHTISFVGGVSEQKNTYTAMGGSGIPPNSVIRDLGQVRNLQLDALGNGQSIYSLASQFARLTYNFNDRYLVTGTIRRDGSSKFDAGHQYGTFPSGAVAWKAKEESFLKNVDWLSDLKIRASYGEVGNQGSIGLFQYQSLYSTGSAPATSGNLGYPFDKLYQGGIASVQPANPNLKWETDTQTDIGADISFLHGDLTVTVDWFDRKSKDFLLTLAAPAQTGYNFLTRNVGSMENKGFEFAINYNHRTSEFKYGVGLTLTTVSNKLTSITSGTNFVTNFGGLSLAGIGWSTFTETNVGQPVGEFYGYKTLGIFQTQAQVDALNAAAAAKNPSNPYYQKTATGPGDRYFADTNGDGQVTPADQVSLGSPIPKFYGGLNFDFSYRAWDFNAYFYGVYGNKILNYEESSLESFQNRSFVGVENVSYDYYLHHWTPTNPSNIYARANYNDDAIGSNVPSSSWIQNGSFLKLKNLTIGYTLPADLVSKASLAKVRVYFSTQNLFTITSYKGLDPEVGMQGGNATQNGVDNGTYPSSRFYTIGLNVTFK